MSSSGGGIGTMIIGGIQYIAAILPLLGTEQCSVQVSSALTRGYLHAAATPISIFGSLGVVVAGFKTLLACFSFRNIEGAKILGNLGFEPLGENLSLIMVEAGKGKMNAERYIIETRMDRLIAELNMDENRIAGVSHKSAFWNVKMMATTALFCAFSISPYIYLILVANGLDKSTTWLFPVLRATGGFITTSLIQLLLQRRITTLSNQYLDKKDQPPNPDLESGVQPAVEPDDTKKRQMDARTWLLLCFLLIGLIASVVGYVGCFSIVQNSMSSAGPVSWLCLEAGLSVIRLAIWAYNPTSDAAPPLEIILKLDEYDQKPHHTCKKDYEEISHYKVLPLTRARDFLKIITSFAGLIEPFSHPDLSLYYTLTWKRPFKESVPADTENVLRLRGKEAENYRLGERILFITVFHRKERTTRVYTRDNEKDILYSTRSDAPHVVSDFGRYRILKVDMEDKIDPRCDPVSSDSDILDSLRKHHQSILENIQYRLGAGEVTKPYVIENSWTMKVEDTTSVLQRLNRDAWRTVVKNGKEEEKKEESKHICFDFMQPTSVRYSIEATRQRKEEKERRAEQMEKRLRAQFRDPKMPQSVREIQLEKDYQERDLDYC